MSLSINLTDRDELSRVTGQYSCVMEAGGTNSAILNVWILIQGTTGRTYMYVHVQCINDDM